MYMICCVRVLLEFVIINNNIYTIDINIYIFIFFFNDTATTEIYTLSLHDALPILRRPGGCRVSGQILFGDRGRGIRFALRRDRKSTRLNSSHMSISYAVFCLKKKKNNKITFYKIIHTTTNTKYNKQILIVRYDIH